MNALLLAVLISATGEPASPTPPPASPTTRAHVDVLRLRTSGIDADHFARELALRVPEARIVAHDDEPSTPGSMVFVDLQPRDSPQSFSLTLVTSDGRAYDRTIDADPSSSADDVVRLLAGNVGNLIAAIEAGTATADRQDVVIPVPAPPAPVCPACPDPKPAPPQRPIATPATPPPPPPVEIGIGLAPITAIGLAAPDDADRFLGGGGSLALMLRHRTGVLVGADVRVLGRRLPFDTSLVRTRVAIALGYAWRKGTFELATAAQLGVEPWSVRAGGERSALGDPNGEARARKPLLGGGVSIVPAHRFEGRGYAVRVGPRLELSASSAIGDRGRVAKLLVDDGDVLRTVGRLGGWELALGLEVVVWIPVRGAKR